MTASPTRQSTPDVLSYLHQRILERNEAETDPFQSVHSSNLAFQNAVDNLQYQCNVLQKEKTEQDRIIDQLTEEIDGNNNNDTSGGGGGGGKSSKGSGPSKTEARQRDKIEKLQEQLNDKLRAEVESSASALKVANELAEVKDANAAHMATIKSLQEEQAKTERTITKLNSELTNAQSMSNLAEKQYNGLKDTIRTLQEENDELKKINSDLVGRVVSEKEKAIDEINKMNAMVEKLQKEVDMLRAYQKQQEERARGRWRRNKGGGLDVGGDLSSSSAAANQGKDGSAGRKFGALGVVLPSQPMHVLQAHGQEATAVRYDGTGTDLIATGSSDSTVRVWDSSTGQPKALLRGGSGHPMLGVDISGGVVAGCGSDKTCRVWNLRTQRLVSTIVLQIVPTSFHGLALVNIHRCLLPRLLYICQLHTAPSTCWPFTQNYMRETLSQRERNPHRLCRSLDKNVGHITKRLQTNSHIPSQLDIQLCRRIQRLTHGRIWSHGWRLTLLGCPIR